MLHPVFRASGFASFPLAVLGAGVALSLLTACASKGPSLQVPCRVMQEQIREKQGLDAQVNTLAKQAARYQRQGDTASAASAEHRLKGLRENQRLLKESLEQSSRDCSPTLQEPVPVRDPARRERMEERY
jgi:hypothetical protein